MEDDKKQETPGLGKMIALVVVGLVAGYFIGASASRQSVTTDDSLPSSVELQFVNHLQAELPEQDVFILSGDNSGQVVRIDVGQDSDEVKQMQAYSTLGITEHDPFKLGSDPLGPYPIGNDLGFTIGDWLSAAGSGKYSVDAETATLAASFENLVPEGVYTVWCSRLKFPPSPAVIDTPCGAIDGSENVFTADAEGRASNELSFPPLMQSTESEAQVFALAYHSDGKTYGYMPGDFGSSTHVQIFAMLPPKGE